MSLIKKQLNTLNRWFTVELQPSDIHGIGVFAVKDLPKGTNLFMNIMPYPFHIPYKDLEDNVPEYVLEKIKGRWPNVTKGEAFVFPDARYLAYCNHSDKANYDAKTDVTLKDIKKGEEITEDYRLIDNYEKIYPWLK